MTEVEVLVLRFPSVVAIAMTVAPLVRFGYLTDAEGRQLVDLRYVQALAELREADQA